MANHVLLNLTLFLTVHFCAVHGYAATHMHITHVLCFSSILPPPCGGIMLLISAMPAYTVSVDLVPTCTYNMIVYTDQGIDWHSQSDSLGVSSLKQTCSTHPIISGLCHVVESLGQLICFLGCFTRPSTGYEPC